MRNSLLLRYGVAAVAVGLALHLQWHLLIPLFGVNPNTSPFMAFFAAVAVGAWFGGLGPGLLATGLSALVSWYFLLPPQYSFALESLGQGLRVVAFASECTLISLLIQALHSARRRAEVSALEARSRQADLRRSEERFGALVQNSSDIITVIDAQGTIRYVSPAVERVTGHHPEELVGKSVYDYVRPDDLEEAHGLFAQAWSRAGVQPPFEFDVPHKDGSWRRSEFILNNLLDDPNVRGVVVNQRDITERKRAEEEHARLAAIVESSDDAILGKTLDGTITSWNRAAERLYGYSAEEAVGQPVSVLVPPDRPDELPEILRKVRRGQTIEQLETVQVTRDGRRLDVSVTISPVRDAEGNVVGASTIVRDVTERKKVEKALRSSLNSLIAVYEAGQAFASSLEQEEVGLRLLRVTQRMSSLEAAVLGLCDERGELEERHSVGAEEVLAAVRGQPRAMAAAREAAADGRPRSLELHLSGEPGTGGGRRTTGVFVPLRVRDRAIGVLEAYGPRALQEEGSMETLASLANQAASALENARLYGEIAQRERRLEDLVGRILLAQEEERRRVAYEIHDGLTQLAAAAYQRLALFAEHHPPDSAQDREELEDAVALVQRMVGEARRVIANLRPTALDDFGLAAAVRMHVNDLRAEGFEASYEETLGGERLPATLETALFRVAQEALANARKHSQTDRVHVSLRRGEGGGGDGAVRLEVRDWGRGFKVPAGFRQGGGPGERVGLSSMQERVALLGGRLEVRSEPGAGTSVVAEVPLPAVIEAQEDGNGRG